MATAHLLLAFDVTSGTPVFHGAAIKSEDANSITSDLSGRMCLVTGETGIGGTFGEAKADLLERLRDSPFYSGWVFKHLED